MTTKLFIVKEVFEHQGQIWVATDKLMDIRPREELHAGQTIELRKPDGARVHVRIDSIPLVNPFRIESFPKFICFACSDIKAEDIPPRSEVWLPNDKS